MLNILETKQVESSFYIRSLGKELRTWTELDQWSEYKFECEQFCKKQITASDWLQDRIEEFPDLKRQILDRENSELCQRLTYQNFMASQFQRLTKYPMILSEIIKVTAENEYKEKEDLKIAMEKLQKLLTEVNSEVKISQDTHQLKTVTKKLDTTELTR